jgi:hypothetical protein
LQLLVHDIPVRNRILIRTGLCLFQCFEMFKLKRLLLEVKWPPSCGIGGHFPMEYAAT